jgi:hypothetical protein
VNAPSTAADISNAVAGMQANAVPSTMNGLYAIVINEDEFSTLRSDEAFKSAILGAQPELLGHRFPTASWRLLEIPMLGVALYITPNPMEAKDDKPADNQQESDKTD